MAPYLNLCLLIESDHSRIRREGTKFLKEDLETLEGPVKDRHDVGKVDVDKLLQVKHNVLDIDLYFLILLLVLQ